MAISDIKKIVADYMGTTVDELTPVIRKKMWR